MLSGLERLLVFPTYYFLFKLLSLEHGKRQKYRSDQFWGFFTSFAAVYALISFVWATKSAFVNISWAFAGLVQPCFLRCLWDNSISENKLRIHVNEPWVVFFAPKPTVSFFFSLWASFHLFLKGTKHLAGKGKRNRNKFPSGLCSNPTLAFSAFWRS